MTFLPFSIICLGSIFRKPIFGFFTIFTCNYFIIAFFRYSGQTGMSFIIDVLIILTLIATLVQSALYQTIRWNRLKNPAVIGMTVWMIYTILEILNPTAKFEAWITSRQLIYGCLIIAILTSVLFSKTKYVYTLIIVLSAFTLAASIKAILQKFIGFDPVETHWLYEEGGALTHIIATGTRYFSFFSDASNLGSNMGFATIVYSIIALYTKNPFIRIYYLIVSGLACYSMFLSGTRGAIVVPLGGLAYFCILSKNIKGILISSILLVGIFCFFAFTNIGASNASIRRMRTAFTPSEDASFNVRKENQKLIAQYMKNKPFGEGMGLGGVEAQRFGESYINSIPVDSWYVKLWVETGWVGLSLYLIILLSTLFWGSYNLMFKTHNKKLKSIIAALGSGCFGLMISAYGNSFFGQYPTHFIVFICLTLMVIAPYIEDCNDTIINLKTIK